MTATVLRWLVMPNLALVAFRPLLHSICTWSKNHGGASKRTRIAGSPLGPRMLPCFAPDHPSYTASGAQGTLPALLACPCTVRSKQRQPIQVSPRLRTDLVLHGVTRLLEVLISVRAHV